MYRLVVSFIDDEQQAILHRLVVSFIDDVGLIMLLALMWILLHQITSSTIAMSFHYLLSKSLSTVWFTVLTLLLTKFIKTNRINFETTLFNFMSSLAIKLMKSAPFAMQKNNAIVNLSSFSFVLSLEIFKLLVIKFIWKTREYS